MMIVRRSRARGYAVALAGTVLLMAIDAVFDELLRTFLLVTVYVMTVLLASAAGGWRPGLFATVLSVAVHLIVFTEPRFRLQVDDRSEYVRALMYGIVGAAISLLGGGLQFAWGRIAERQRLLEQEIEERKSVAAALEKAEAQAREESRRGRQHAKLLHVTLASIGDAVVATDSSCNVTFMNRLAEQLTGWTLEEARNRPLKDVFRIINERTREAVEDPCAKVLATGQIVGLANHTVLIARDGSELPIEDSAAPIQDESGSIFGVVLVFRDATRERMATNALKRLAAIVSSSNDAIIGISVDGIITEWNEAAEKAYGYSAQDAIGQHIHLIVPEDRRRELAEIMDRLKFGERIQHLDTVRVHRDGTRVDVSLQISPIIADDDHGGEVIGISKIDRDITERKRSEEALMFLTRTSTALAVLTDRPSALERASRLMVEYIADFCAIHMLDNEGEIQAHASAHRDPQRDGVLRELLAAHVLNWNSASLPVQALRTGKTQHLRQVSAALLEQLAADPRERELLRRLSPKSLICVPLRIRNRLVGVITFAHCRREYTSSDVSLAEDLAQRVATAIDNAELLESVRAADRQKDEFLAMLAHELRNPLAAISYANSLMQLSNNEPQPELIELVDRQVANLSHLVDDLLDVSRISRDKIQLRREHLDLTALVRRSVASVQPLAEARQHRISLDITDEPLPLYVDPTRIEQILTNLLVNAVKFTPVGGNIQLSVSRRQGEAVAKVKDNGMGIPPEMLARVFDLFTQADRSLDRSEGGLGIGLTIARKLAEMHGGTLTAASEGIGHGAEFTLRLPLCNTPSPQEAPQSGGGTAATRLRILVVDDNRDTAQMESLLLTRLGHTVEVAHTGTEALAVANTFHPQAILLDIGLPEIDGYEVARRLRNDGVTNALLIAISGYGRPEDIERSREAGFDHHLVKPVNSSQLIAALQHYQPPEESHD